MKVTTRTRKDGTKVPVCDWYEFGERRVKTFRTKRDAEDFKAEYLRKNRQRVKPQVDARIILRDFAPIFLERCRGLGIKPKTIEYYDRTLRLHILPVLGDHRVRDFDRPTAEAFLLAKSSGKESRQGQKGAATEGRRQLKRGSVRNMLMILSGMMRHAVAVQLLVANPLARLARDVRLGKRKKGSAQLILTFDQPQLVRFLAAARDVAPEEFPAFAVMGLAGTRLGEAIALEWEHIDFAGKRLRLCKQISGSLKDDEVRDVEMSDALVAILRELETRRLTEAFRQGRPLSPYALFPEFEHSSSRKAEQAVIKRIQTRMKRVIKAAGVPKHHTPKSLRHSFASILISKGKPLVYVQRALGHASIEMTVGTYGSWIPVEAPGAVNLLSEGLAMEPVIFRASTGNTAPHSNDVTLARRAT